MSEELARIRSRIEALGMNFQFMGTMKTNVNGVERETWILEYKGDPFVYVAGQKNVILGWDIDQCSLGRGVLDKLQEECEAGYDYYQNNIEDLRAYYEKNITKAKNDGDFGKVETLTLEMEEEIECVKGEWIDSGCTSWENFISKWNENLSCCLSPLRTADIGDMIVEVDSRYIEEDAPSLIQAVHSLKEGPFTLATEDEWEYLCNCGARTLFRWGDTLDNVLDEIYNVGCVSKKNEITSSVLNQNNNFGLFISYNSYKMEIIDSTQYTKGGDGGCSICGGDGPIYVLPCYTAFYRYPVDENEQSLSKHYYSYRRMIRLPK